MKRQLLVFAALPLLLLLIAGVSETAWSNLPASPLTEEPVLPAENEQITILMDRAPGDPVDLDAALSAGADYLQGMQADVTDDNAGNGTDGVDETPDDPDDGGWDWRVTSPPAPFHHTTAASSTNLFGVTAMGLYYAYLETSDAGHFTALTDAADKMLLDPTIDSGPDIPFLVLYNALPAVSGTTYRDGARAKYDAKIVSYGSATALAEFIRDLRAGQGYENGIIAWDISAWVKAAAILDATFPGNGYDSDADDMAEVIYQDSFNDTPGYFDIVDDAGWDPTYADTNFWWYNLGIAGLIEGFQASGSHSAEIPGLISILLDGVYSTGAVSECYGANTDDEDWQSTAYAALAFAAVDQSSHQLTISHIGYWLGATQDASGGWRYDSGNHYPEVGGECTAAISFATPPSDVVVDDDFTSQDDVDVYNSAHASSYVWGYDAFATVQEGIGAVEGSTVDIQPGTYVETGQIVIDKDLTITGAGMGSTILNKAEDSGNTGSGNDRGWFLVQAGYTLDMSGLTLDGVGRQICIAVLNYGEVALANCEFKNIGWTPSSYYGRGVCIYSGTGNTVSGCSFENILRIGIFTFGTGVVADIDNCTYTGKGDGDWLDYGFEAGGGGVIAVSNSTVTACTGVAYDGSTSAGLLLTTYFGAGTAGTITDCTITGNTTGIAVGYDGSDTTACIAHGNDLSGNTDYGVTVTGTVVADATGNWWGHASGPYHATSNPGGQGVAVSDNVSFDPWTGMATMSILPASSGPINCSDLVTLDFHYTPDAMTPAMRGYSIQVQATGEVSFGSGDITVYTLPSGATTVVEILANGANDFTIDYAIMGATSGITTEEDLFSIVFHPVSDGTATINIAGATMRDLVNAPIGAIYSATATIEVDCTAPGAPSDITASPGHEKVTVTWTDPSPVDFTGLEIWRGMWHDGSNNSVYPEYDDHPTNTIPTRPASRAAADASAEWVLAGTVLPGVGSFVDNHATRGVYYYEVFAVDAAVNYGPPAAANDRATNYWLGDVQLAYDGDVDAGDITVLGATYGDDPSDPSYNNECDVGPTDDDSGTGIPLTDDYIGFEDLMIFSLTYGEVAPMSMPQDGTDIAQLSWYALDETSWALALLEPCKDLKGLELRASLPEGVTVTGLSPGSVLEHQAGAVFLQNAGGLDIGLAILGRDLGIVGNGELLRVTLSEAHDLSNIELSARSKSNETVEFKLLATEMSDTPAAYRLAGNYPNPFNPKTHIRFDLPEMQAVKLTIFGPDGRRVLTLLDELLPAGYHSVAWNGRDDRGEQVASGVYFYRIEAGPLRETSKMLLLK